MTKEKRLTILGCVLLVLTFSFVIVYYVKPHVDFKIKPDEQAIQTAISEMLDQQVQIRLMEDRDDKRIVVFTLGLEVGEASLTKGRNDKFRLDSAGHGSNEVRYRILETEKGQYVKFAGRNNDGVARILAFVDGEPYHVQVPEGDYFISLEPLTEPTKTTFPTGSVWYDRLGGEILRIGISNDMIIQGT